MLIFTGIFIFLWKIKSLDDEGSRRGQSGEILQNLLFFFFLYVVSLNFTRMHTHKHALPSPISEEDLKRRKRRWDHVKWFGLDKVSVWLYIIASSSWQAHGPFCGLFAGDIPLKSGGMCVMGTAHYFLKIHGDGAVWKPHSVNTARVSLPAFFTELTRDPRQQHVAISRSICGAQIARSTPIFLLPEKQKKKNYLPFFLSLLSISIYLYLSMPLPPSGSTVARLASPPALFSGLCKSNNEIKPTRTPPPPPAPPPPPLCAPPAAYLSLTC